MGKKCLPTPAKGMFLKNPTFPNNYDLTPESGANLPFSYFRLSMPKEMYLSEQRALYVVESHVNGIKVLHTGLRQTKTGAIYSGDLFDCTTKKKSLLLFRLLPNVNGCEVFFYDGYFPRSLAKVINQIAAL